MKTLLTFFAILALASCEAIQEHVSIVNDRGTDGTYLPLNQVKHPKSGASAVAVGKFYIFSDGTAGVTAAYGPSGPVAAPKLTLTK